MAIKHNSFTISGKRYKDGFFYNTYYDEKDGSLKINKSLQVCGYFSCAFDSLDDDTVWNRFVSDTIIDSTQKYTIYFKAQNKPFDLTENQYGDIDEFLNSESSFEEKVNWFKTGNVSVFTNKDDILLYDLCGRYLWVYIEFFSNEYENIEIKSFKIDFPKQSFISYLPEIYSQNNEFLERFLAIFESIFLDIEKKIDSIPYYLDINTTDERMINFLGSCVGIDNSDNKLSIEQMKKMIKSANYINSIRGTKQAINEIVEIYTGKEPIIIEYHQWIKYARNDSDLFKLYCGMYGSDENTFTIIITNENLYKNININNLKDMVERYKPINSKQSIIMLTNSMRIDTHTYLGINSVLGDVTDGKSDISVLDNSALA